MKQISTTSASFSQFNNSETIDLYFTTFTIYFLRNFKKMNEELKVFFVSVLFFQNYPKAIFLVFQKSYSCVDIAFLKVWFT